MSDALDALRRCTDDSVARPGSSVVDAVIVVLGLPDRTRARLRSAQPAHLVVRERDAGSVRLTLGALVVLRAADSAERSRAAPSVVYERAVQAVSGYLYIRPRR